MPRPCPPSPTAREPRDALEEVALRVQARHRRPGRDARAPARRAAGRRPRAARGRPRPGQDADRQDARRGARRQLPPHPVHARPRARRPRRHAHLAARHRHASTSSSARCSATSCSPTRSTARRPRCSRRCSRSCRSTRSRSAAQTHRVPEPVPRARHAEPDRVRGHLPAARGAGRPLPVQARSSTTRPPGRRPRSSTASLGADVPSRASASTLDRARRDHRAAVARPCSSTARSIGYAVALADATRRPGHHGLDDLEPLRRVRRQPARADRPGPGAPARSRCCAAAATSSARTCATSRPTCCATGSCCPTTRSPTASAPTTSSTGSSPRSTAAADGLRREAARRERRPASSLRPPAGRQGPGPLPRRRWSPRSTSPSRAARAARCPASTARPGVGAGTELAQLRPYEPGDDVRQLDPAASARTGVAARPPARARARADDVDRARRLASMAFGTADRLKSDVAEGVATVVGRAGDAPRRPRRGPDRRRARRAACCRRAAAAARSPSLRRLLAEGVAPDGAAGGRGLAAGASRACGRLARAAGPGRRRLRLPRRAAGAGPLRALGAPPRRPRRRDPRPARGRAARRRPARRSSTPRPAPSVEADTASRRAARRLRRGRGRAPRGASPPSCAAPAPSTCRSPPRATGCASFGRRCE